MRLPLYLRACRPSIRDTRHFTSRDTRHFTSETGLQRLAGTGCEALHLHARDFLYSVETRTGQYAGAEATRGD
jgi:hypothetical protein